ncbi:MAG: glycosyltransferase [Desulfurococcaceae archaeon]
MKSVIVRHHMLNAHLMGIGGSHYVMLETAIAFAERGLETYIDSPFITSRCELLRLAEFFGVNKKELVGIGIGEPKTSELVVINTSGDVLSGAGDVMYLHYPFFLDYRTYYSPLHGVFDLFGKVYSLTNTIAFPVLARKVKLYLANSWFTAVFFKKYLRVNPIVIHPPVNLDNISNKEPLPYSERGKYVLTVSRISPEKRPERAIYLAKLLKKHGIRVTVVGVLSSYNKPLYDALVELALKERVDDYLDILVNISREDLIELYRTALAYIHVTPKEHFGISVVEAMAAGTPAIVPVDSGTWIDVAQQNPLVARPYRSVKEAYCTIKDIAENQHLWNMLSLNGRARALELDRKLFKEKVYEITKPLICG